MKPAPFHYERAVSAAQAIAQLAGGDGMVKLCAGSQSLGPMLNLRLAQPGKLIDISQIQALRGFELIDDGLRIGAAMTHARIEDGELPDLTRGLLPTVAAGIAYRAIRNRGTLGGSLAHADPAADWVSCMSLLDAVVCVAGSDSERRLPVSELFLGPFTTSLAEDELIIAVEVPRFSRRARWAYRKYCRKPGEFAEAIAALWIDDEHNIARAVFGSFNGMPRVITGAEEVARLRDPKLRRRSLDESGLVDDYQREMHSAMLRRAFEDVDS
jgi:aerobic carbon-monoxide dehydrogenase medium subunit